MKVIIVAFATVALYVVLSGPIADSSRHVRDERDDSEPGYGLPSDDSSRIVRKRQGRRALHESNRAGRDSLAASANGRFRHIYRQGRIRDGTKVTNRADMPYIGRINTCFKPLGRFTCVLCAGVLLNSRWFLTAAHCVNMPIGSGTGKKGLKIKTMQITLGELNKDNTTEPGTKIVNADTSNIKVASGYDKDFRNHDLALVRLGENVTEVTGVIQYMKLPLAGAQLTQGTGVRMCGWGFYDPEKYLLSSQLRCGDANVTSQSSCNVYYNSTQFCTTSEKQTNCFGDAGGPVYTISDPTTLVGIISYNTPNCPAGKGQYRHMLVSNYTGWINDTISSY